MLKHESSLNDISFLSKDRKTNALINSIDWSTTPIGNADGWPQSLRSALSICLNSNFPIAIYWGKELVLLYNEAWSPIPGNKHPWAFGKRAIEVWPEIWADIEPQFEKAFSGFPGGSKDALLPMQRHGYTEECYFDFTFTPIYGESGKVEGIFNAVIETTYRVTNERRGAILQRLTERISGASSQEEIFAQTVAVIEDAPLDVSFFLVYEVAGTEQVLLAQSTNISPLTGTRWPSDELIVLDNLAAYLSNVPSGYWPEKPAEAIIVPIKSADGGFFGFMVGGLSARRRADKEYKGFFESISNIIAGELTTLQSLIKERERAESLAQIDKAKTAFFSNISHEFRTPLTLMASPLEEVLLKANYLKEGDRSHLETSLRNTLRLQKLVNTLLDFSKIEAGKLEATFQHADVEQLTKDLASSFRSAIEAAGIKYDVTVQKLNRIPMLDVEMWEKIVLNLISNAFKYTESGQIQVELIEQGEALALKVSDTGVGIAEENLPRIFERFYRINNQGGRSQEGTGIGLAMVKELVHLHNGAISVESRLGLGTTFTVTIPFSSGSISKEPKSNGAISSSKLRKTFVEEASRWDLDTIDVIKSNAADNHGIIKPIIIVADDNHDMRAYITRILSDAFTVHGVNNGEDALSKAHELMPELILSDIMMPKLDGFGLLTQLKANFATRNIPVIFLSARAGEEAKVEGIEAGADDYLVKPFSARELLARVTNQININRVRRQAEKQFFNLFLQSPAHIHVMRGPDHIFEFFHPLGKSFTGGRDFTGKKVREALPEVEGQGYFEMLDQVYHEGKSFNIPESKAFLKNEQGELTEYFFHITYLPWRDVDGKILGVLQFSFDVTQQVKARLVLEEAEYKLQNAIELADLGTWHIDLTTNFVSYDSRIVKWWGLDAKGATLERVIKCLHEDDRSKVAEAVNHAIMVSGVYSADYRLINSITGETRHIIANGKVFYDDEKKPLRLSGIARDITLQKIAQDELEKLVSTRTRELYEANAELKRSNEDLQQFAYVASHDLQEPLRKIQTFSDLALSRLHDTNAAKLYLDKIDQSAARMTSLIKDVLAYSQASRKEFTREPVDLHEIIGNVKNDFELLIQQKNVIINVSQLPVVQGSKRQFHQLFSNLLSNSIKFSRLDPRIEITARTLKQLPDNVVLRASSAYHELSVKDNGIGFEPAYTEQIFQLFSRLHNRYDYGGTGIGLSLCKKIVENHDGTIVATSQKGKGSTFTIYLPQD